MQGYLIKHALLTRHYSASAFNKFIYGLMIESMLAYSFIYVSKCDDEMEQTVGIPLFITIKYVIECTRL